MDTPISVKSRAGGGALPSLGFWWEQEQSHPEWCFQRCAQVAFTVRRDCFCTLLSLRKTPFPNLWTFCVPPFILSRINRENNWITSAQVSQPHVCFSWVFIIYYQCKIKALTQPIPETSVVYSTHHRIKYLQVFVHTYTHSFHLVKQPQMIPTDNKKYSFYGCFILQSLLSSYEHLE